MYSHKPMHRPPSPPPTHKQCAHQVREWSETLTAGGWEEEGPVPKSHRARPWQLPRSRSVFSEPLSPQTVRWSTLNYKAYAENRRHYCGHHFKSKSKTSLWGFSVYFMLDHRVKSSEPLSGIFRSTLMKPSDLSELLVQLPATALPF